MSNYLISEIINEDGTKFDPPKNPLLEKWEKLYVPNDCGPISGYDEEHDKVYMNYGCVLCTSDKCHHSNAWKIPEEDKEIYEEYRKSYMDYIKAHNPKISCIDLSYTFKTFMDFYDNWNGIVKVNYYGDDCGDDWEILAYGKISNIMESRKDLYNIRVMSFGHYDGELCVRLANKPSKKD